MNLGRGRLLIFIGIVFLGGIALGAYMQRNGIPFVGMEKVPIPWSIGIYKGKSPLSLAAPQEIENPVLKIGDIADINAEFLADPFMVQHDDTWYMFFEVMNKETRQGDIGLASSTDALNWTYKQIVLDEPFHLSFPYIIRWNGAYYMLPESHEADSIRLYKADNFPTRWPFAGELIEGRYVDTTIFYFRDKWWLFTTAPHPKSHFLYLYYSEDLLGPWIEHPKNPVAERSPQGMRSGGTVLVLEDRVIRYVQDIYPRYGVQVVAFEITVLSETDYEERPVGEKPIIGASGKGWNGRGMHHVDPHRIGDKEWIAVVDGYGQSKKLVFGLDR